MDEYLRFAKSYFLLKQLHFFYIFCSRQVFITDFYTFLILIMYLQLSKPHCIVNKNNSYPLSSTLCLNLIIPVNFGEVYTWKEFSVSKVGS